MERVHVEPAMARYVVALPRHTRDDAEVEVGVSPRGSLALLKLAQARALAGARLRDPDDVKAVAVPALAHRLILAPEARSSGVTARGDRDGRRPAHAGAAVRAARAC